MPELSDNQLEEFMDAVEAMPTPSFYPPGARESGLPFIERHRIALGASVFTVWHDDNPIAFNLDSLAKTCDEYLDYLDVVGLTYSPPAS